MLDFVNPIRLMHLDDDPLALTQMERAVAAFVGARAFVVEAFEDAGPMLAAAAAHPPDVALLDVHLKGATSSGIDVIPRLRAVAPSALVVMLSNDLAAAREAIAAGADDFVLKRAAAAEVLMQVQSTLQLVARYALPPRGTAAPASAAVGATMEAIGRRVAMIVASAITAVHVTGESGVGKEVVASLFQAASGAGVPFVRVNCGAFAESLLERELFGHAKGSFTGAVEARPGLIEAASGGWLFLDEIATLKAPAQIALLRALESHEVTRIGEQKARSVDFRVISASNVALPELVARGEFRGDLWQRLCEGVIDVPPLRERRSEIPALLAHFCRTEKGGPYRLSPEAEALLAAATWEKGNVRELRNCVRSMTERHVDKLLTPMGIPAWAWDGLGTLETPPEPATEAGVGAVTISLDGAPPPTFAAMTDVLLVAVLRAYAVRSPRPSFRQTSATLGLARSTLAYRVKMLRERGLLNEAEIAGWFTA